MTDTTRKISSHQQNSEFLTTLFLEENKHINPVEFIFKDDKASNYSCVCVSLGVVEKYQDIRASFFDNNKFSAIYFEIYLNALENYRSIVGVNDRQIFVTEAKIFYPLSFTTHNIKNSVSNAESKQKIFDIIESLKTNHGTLMILRDEIAFVVIHHENDDYILIDPHVECCGILTKNNIYRYVVYDGIWDFDVDVMVLEAPSDN